MGEVFKLNHCYNMDCLPAMELFPDNYFDLAVVDPPYFSGPERRGFYGSKVSKIGVHRDYPVSPAWSKPEPEYFRELFRVCRHYIVWGCNYFDYQFATGRIVWDKCSGSSRIAAYEAGLGFIGFEIDPFYFQLEEERFSEHTSQTSLFHMEGKKK